MGIEKNISEELCIYCSRHIFDTLSSKKQNVIIVYGMQLFLQIGECLGFYRHKKIA